MPALTIKTRIKTKRSIDPVAHLQALERDLGPQLAKFSTSAYRFLEKYINDHRKRKVNTKKQRLARAFKKPDIEFSRGVVRFSIGDIGNLDTNFPYWKLLEHGGQVWTNSEGAPGWFGHRQQPSSDFVGGSDKFNYNAYVRGNYLLTGVHTIAGIGYLRATNAWISRNWNRVWEAYITKRKFTVPTFRKSKAVKKKVTQLPAGNPSTTVKYTDLI